MNQKYDLKHFAIFKSKVTIIRNNLYKKLIKPSDEIKNSPREISIPDKLGGVIVMISAILILLLLPILNTSVIRCSEFRPIFSISYWFLVADFILLGWIGQKLVESPYIELGMTATFFYFFYFLTFIPIVGIVENKLFYRS